MVKALERQQVKARPSYQIFSAKAPLAGQLFSAARALGVGTIYVTHLSAGDDRPELPSGGHDLVTARWSWAQYTCARARAYEGAPEQPPEHPTLETDVFALTPYGRRLVWRGTTRDVDLGSPRATAVRVEEQLVPMLRQEHLLAIR